MDPELVEQVEAQDRGEPGRWKTQQGQWEVEDPGEEPLERSLPKRHGEVVTLAGMVYHVPGPGSSSGSWAQIGEDLWCRVGATHHNPRPDGGLHPPYTSADIGHYPSRPMSHVRRTLRFALWGLTALHPARSGGR